MKKILHISKYYYPFRGGTEQIAQDCVNALGDSYEQKVVCFNHELGNKKDRVDGVEVIRCGCFAKVQSQSLSLVYGKVLKDVLRQFQPDIVVFHYPNPFVAHYLLKYLDPGCKLVVYWHLDIVKQKFLGQFFHRQNARLVRRADKIVATSPPYIKGSKWLSRAGGKCAVVPNCINQARMEMDVRAEERSGQIRKENPDKILCLAVGRHTEYKGFSYLIQAAKYLDDRFRIFLTGEGELTAKLKEESAGDSKITFLGVVDDTELKAYMDAMDIFCFSSITKNEAFGVALAEGMYYGKPAVTFTIPGSGVNYVSLHGETGLEVPNRDIKAYAEAMKQLAGNPELRKRYGENARRRVMGHFLSGQYEENIRKVMREI